jgi:hypothetical protein
MPFHLIKIKKKKEELTKKQTNFKNLMRNPFDEDLRILKVEISSICCKIRRDFSCFLRTGDCRSKVSTKEGNLPLS